MNTPEHLKSPAELVAEGRRWVLHPMRDEDGVFRAEVIFEDHPFRCPFGEVSSDPAAKRPIFLGTDPDVAEAWAERWNAEQHGISPEDYRLIVLSSMAAQAKMRRLVAKRDPSTSVVTLSTGFGDELVRLEEDEAKQLYVQLARAYFWAHDDFCPECGAVMEDGSCPEDCMKSSDEDSE